MKVLKFGGSSLANADKFMQVADIINMAQAENSVAVVLSAPAKVTNHLVALLEHARTPELYAQHKQAIYEIFMGIISELSQKQKGFAQDAMVRRLQKELAEIDEICAKELSAKEHAQVAARGEMLSIALMYALLDAQNRAVFEIKPQQLLRAEGHYLSAQVDIAQSLQQAKALNLPQDAILLMAGFSAGNQQDEVVLLGRNGSDYSAACLAACLEADVCEIWTDVDGIYTCDPRLVPNAKLLSSLSYLEAMELSYFGAKVLHPRTISPLFSAKIPCLIKNTQNPQALGSSIHHEVEKNGEVKGITHLDKLAMFNVSGSAMQGQVGMASRVFSALSKEGVSIILITQSSSEYSISFCVPMDAVSLAKNALQAEFAEELALQQLDEIGIQEDLAIVSVIGDGMVQAKGVAARFFSALSQADINIIAIAQGASERSISAVIPACRAMEAVKQIHQRLFEQQKKIDVFLVGVGGVGAALMAQIGQQKTYLANKGIELNVCGVANSRYMLLNENGIDFSQWQSQLTQSQRPFDLQEMYAFRAQHHLVNAVLVDCTSSDAVAESYADALAEGFHVVTPNKKANTKSMQYYALLRENAFKHQRKFLYDTNVGAGLPVIENLQNLLAAGDELIQFNGILSGSLSFIFGKLDEGLSLSQATLLAKEKGFTEPDPRDDLSGQDVARKLLILARECGLNLELADIQVDSVLPQGFTQGLSSAEFLELLPALDESFQEKMAKAKAHGAVLRYVGQIKDGKCRVSIQEVEENDPLFKVKDGENALAFYTKFYQPIPLLLRGYGAGNAVTAAGVFADILRTLQQ